MTVQTEVNLNKRFVKALQNFPKRAILLISLLLLWTIILITYTYWQQNHCNPVTWWRQGVNTECWQISVEPPRLELSLGETQNINLDIENIGWHSPSIDPRITNPRIATIQDQSEHSIRIKAKAVDKTQVKVEFGIEDNLKYRKESIIPIEVLPVLEVQPINIPLQEKAQIKYNLRGVSGVFSDKSVDWRVDDRDIIQIDRFGQIQGLKEGKTTITAIWQKDKRVKDTVEIEVTNNPVKVEQIEIASYPTTLYAGDTSENPLKAKVKCSGVGKCDQSVFWESSNLNIASVDRKGQILAQKPGVVQITATSNQDSRKSNSVDLTIQEPLLTKLAFKKKPIEIPAPSFPVAYSTKNIDLEVEGKGNFDRTLNWKSSNPRVIEIDSPERLILKRNGSAQLTVTSQMNPNLFDRANIKVAKNRGCSPEVALAIGTVITLPLIPIVTPPGAVAVGSAGATVICTLLEKFN